MIWSSFIYSPVDTVLWVCFLNLCIYLGSGYYYHHFVSEKIVTGELSDCQGHTAIVPEGVLNPSVLAAKPEDLTAHLLHSIQLWLQPVPGADTLSPRLTVGPGRSWCCLPGQLCLPPVAGCCEEWVSYIVSNI